MTRGGSAPVREFAAALLDVFFPPRCAACHEMLLPEGPRQEAGALCDLCEVTLEPLDLACIRCGLPGDDAECPACLDDPPPFDGVHSVYLYGAAIADVLHRFKYEDHPELAGPLGRRVAALDLPEVDCLTPVPLHASRRRARTYDQALYLARAVASARGWPCERLLSRTRATERQVGRTREDRQENVRGAFAVTGRVKNRRILLIDDVVTTGATVRECSLALKQAGARLVVVASVARAA